MKYCPACHKTFPTDFSVCPADQTGLQTAHELQPGMIIRNKYEILARIGIGGMGVVYRGRHVTFNELCAIKIVNDGIAGDTKFLQRFQTEAVVTRKLRHPNAVRVDDFDYTDDGRPFIVMELVEGKNIGEILQEEGPLRVPRAIRVATQVAQALGVAHKLGVVHRDIKPGNIILTTDDLGVENAKVLDFGIAKLREAAGNAQQGMTMTGMVVGTPLYMSPEQFMGKKAGEEIDGRTDIYSLGVVLYQMVTAQLPFEGDTLYSLMMQHMEGVVRPPHELAPELHIPESLSQLIVKAIDKERAKRFQTADEFVAALEEVSKEQTAQAPPASAPVSNVITAPEAVIAPVSKVAAKTEPSPVAKLPTPPPSPAVTLPTPDPVPPSAASGIRTDAPPQDPVLVNSAAQHLFLQPRTFGLKHLLILVVLALAGVLVAGAGYLKYQSIRRLKIESEVTEKLRDAASPTLRAAGIRVAVSDAREVILDGNVRSKEDFDAAQSVAASVPGVTSVNNRVRVIPAVPPESSESLINRGMSFLDDGNYAAAIDCFLKAAADPKNKGAQELLDRARRAQKTEEELLKNRQGP
jgi:eukaryotic-like serine/threonine-protein kinase